MPSAGVSRGILAIDAADEDMALSAPPPEPKIDGKLFGGGDIESGVGTWLYTFRDERDGAECNTGGINRDGEGCCNGVPTREDVLERAQGVWGVFDIVPSQERFSHA